MQAAFITSHGGADVIKIGDLPTPTLNSGEVLVRIRCAALNHLDIWVRQGIAGLKLSYPHVLGSDASGIVDSVGPGVTGLKCGDEILLHPGLSCGRCEACQGGIESLCADYKILGEQVSGAFAEYVRVPQCNCFPKPENLSWEEAAAIPLVFVTAWEMVVNKGHLKSGEKVLIHAAGSGVSSAAIQIARHRGAEIIATSSSTKKLEQAAKLGATHLIRTRDEDFVSEVKKIAQRGVDLIIDHVGQSTWQGNIKCLKSGGTLVLCGATSGAEATTDLRHLFFRQLRLLGSTMGSKRDFPEILRHLKAGDFRAVVDRVFPLSELQTAYRYLEGQNQFGKVVIRVGPAYAHDSSWVRSAQPIAR